LVVIDIEGPVTITQSAIESGAGGDGDGNGGRISIEASDVSLLDRARISSETSSHGNGGRIDVKAGSLDLDSGEITSGARDGSTGRAGSIGVEAGMLALSNGGRIGTESITAAPAGMIDIAADRILVTGTNSRISSANPSPGTGDAGSVSIVARELSLEEGGAISTSADSGAAGDIVISMPSDGLLRLNGRGLQTLITTSSGPGTGGRILIANPRAIISDGGSILALGQQGGANVQIQSDYFIRSADRQNRVAVSGDFLLEARVGDVSSGTVERDLSILDASGVLRGQCAAVRETGRVSQLVIRPTGPYAPAQSGAPASDRCR
jgi:hypothetical protein